MNGLFQDMRSAIRQLRKSPGFALAAVLTLAVGIGANTAMFSVIHAVLLKPLPYRQAGRLVLLTRGATPVRFEEMKAANQSFSNLAAYAGPSEHMALSGIATPVMLNGARVSWNFLDVLGISPLQGRSFLAEEDEAGAPAVVMISAELWQRQFGGDPGIVGRTITLAGAPCNVIGILPAGFQFPFGGTDVWVTRPVELSGIGTPQMRQISPILRLFGRLKPGIDIAHANAELTVLKRQYAAAHPGMLDGKLDTPEAWSPLKDQVVSEMGAKLWMLLGAVGLVLLIVCANLGGLLLARATARSREFAVRVAIGASRGRIVRQLLAESVLLASVGGALGVILAGFGIAAIRSMTFVDLPRAGEIRIDGTVLGFALAISGVTGIVFGLIPALTASRTNLVGVLKGGADGALPKKLARFGSHSLLVSGQVALSVVLLIGATLLIRSLAHLYRVDPGFQPDHLLTMHISLSSARYDTDAKQRAFYEQLMPRIEALPGVRSAATSLTLPLTIWIGMPVQAAAGVPLKLNERPIAILQFISPEYFRTMKIPLKRGREFAAHDDLSSAQAAIIDETLARRLWPQYPNGPDPVGQYLLAGLNHPPKLIVGISADVREKGKDQDPAPGFYVPLAQSPAGSVALIVRTDGDPLALANAVRAQVLAVDPEQPVSEVMTMDDVVEASEVQLRLMMRLLAVFSAAATLLALSGLYSVISYSVARRTREIGIRRALGAPQREIVSLVAKQGLWLSLTGVAVGVCAALALTRVMKTLLFQVGATDPVTFAGTALLFVLLALAASYLPARRAAKVDPMVALRYE